MYQIQVWLAPPDKCSDNNRIGDIMFQLSASDEFAPVEMIVKRPTIQEPMPRHLNTDGLSSSTLLAAIADAMRFISAAAPPSPTPRGRGPCDPITLTAVDPSNATSRRARLTVMPGRGWPFKYRATSDSGDRWIYQVTVRIASTGLDPWELLDRIFKAFLAVRAITDVVGLEFRVGYGTAIGIEEV